MHTFSNLKWLGSLAIVIISTGFTSIWSAPLGFHPVFGQGQGNDYMYLYYIYKDDVTLSSNGFHCNRLSRLTWTGNSFNPNSELIMINQYDTSKGHDGSGLAFGNDGFLYVSVGDESTQNGRLKYSGKTRNVGRKIQCF